jgi:RNA polymerase sigma-70 factor (ECF subfamily)
VEQQQDWNKCLEQVGMSRDKAAFATLFGHFSPLLKAFLLKSSERYIENVEEIVQETMIKVWRKANNYSSSQGSASTWIYTVARNTRIDAIRRQSRQNPDFLNADDIYSDNFSRHESQTPDISLSRIRDEIQIREKLSELPPEQLQVLNLMYFEGKSGQEVANQLDLPLGTVKSRIRLALNKMKLTLSPSQTETTKITGTRK